MKKGFQLICFYPALILTPIFSNWTFGNSNGCCCFRKSHESSIKISFKLTWGNFFINVVGNMGLLIAHVVEHFKVLGANGSGIYLDYFPFHYLSGFCMITSLITLILLQFLPYCQNLWCVYCQEKCYPIIQKTEFDPTDTSGFTEGQDDQSQMIENGINQEMVQPISIVFLYED